MATSPVLVITIGPDQPVAVDHNDATTVGEIILQFIANNPSIPEFNMNVKLGTLETA
jgi:hypothetical protein